MSRILWVFMETMISKEELTQTTDVNYPEIWRQSHTFACVLPWRTVPVVWYYPTCESVLGMAPIADISRCDTIMILFWYPPPYDTSTLCI